MEPDRRGRPLKVLVIGQTPPPFGGQTVMIEALLSHPVAGISYRHVRMAFSREMTDIGRPSLGKVLHLVSVVARSLWVVWTWRPDIVYYPPGGPARVPVLRDMAVLLAIRPFARRLVLHFHAGGTSQVYERGFRFGWMAWLFRRAFFEADAAVMLARSNPPDGQVLRAKRIFYVANGIEDVAGAFPREPHEPPDVLFVGVHLESKGVVALVEACRGLWDEGLDFTLTTVGDVPEGVGERMRAAAGAHSSSLRMRGVLTGSDKWRRYGAADVLAHPTWYDNQPLAVIEGMMFGLPVVATTWSGLPEMVEDGVTGYLVPPRDPKALAAVLARLIRDEDLRHQMGGAGRTVFEGRFSMDVHIQAMREVFETAAEARPTDSRAS